MIHLVLKGVKIVTDQRAEMEQEERKSASIRTRKESTSQLFLGEGQEGEREKSQRFCVQADEAKRAGNGWLEKR